jgi:hypothetical protein
VPSVASLHRHRSDGQAWPRNVAVAVAAGRVALGAVALVSPAVVARPWVGDDAGPSRAVLGRALGGRDVALGLGLLSAANHDRDLRGWVEASALADSADVAATLLAFDRLPRRGRLAVLAAAGGAAVAGWWAATRCDEPRHLAGRPHHRRGSPSRPAE